MCSQAELGNKAAFKFIRVHPRPIRGSALAFGLLLLLSLNLCAAETFDLTPNLKAGQCFAVKTAVEIKGDLKLNSDGTEVRTLPMLVTADLEYGERLLEAKLESASFRAARHYRTAQTTMRIKDSEMEESVRDGRRLMVAQYRGDEAILFSPHGPLKREELDLIDVPGSSTLLATLLPGKQLAIGEEWKLTDQTVARLLCLEAVSQQDILCTLSKVEEGIAILTLEGKVAGAVGGVATEIDLHGKANFHLKKKAITWLALQYDEKRAIGHAQPGYAATIRVRTIAEPSVVAPELVDKEISRLPLEARQGESLLEFRGEKAGVELLHDRRWNVMVERMDIAILRLIDRGDLIAQCNITRLAPLAKEEPLTLDRFQKSIEQSLSKNNAQIVEANQEGTKEGDRILRVTVSGSASGVSIHWIYYHLTDAKNRRASVVITLESKLLERYASLDRELMSGLTLLDTPSTATSEDKKPTPAGGKDGEKGESARKGASSTKK